VSPDLHYDYTTVGHVTADVLDDGSRRPGGTAFYSALQASRLGLRTLVLTRGAEGEVEELLAPFAGELELRVLPAARTTTLRTFDSLAQPAAGQPRRQQLRAWAGPIAGELAFDTTILHLAPVARETPASWRGPVGFVGLTAQGLARDWSGPAGEIVARAPGPRATRTATRCDAIVLSEHERASCEELLAVGIAGGAVVAVTAGAQPNTIIIPDGAELELEVPPVEHLADDLGAGDVFAAAFFIALADGRLPAEAADFANAAAAVRMAAPGAEAIGRREKIELRLSHAGQR